jgi:hypothetical protein
MFSLIQYLVVREDGSLPEIPDCLYAYILAGNGVFKYAKREGLEVLIQISSAFITGLPALEPRLKIVQRVPAALLTGALQASHDYFPLERLFWFNFNGNWSVYAPEQFCNDTSVVPVDEQDRYGTSALLGRVKTHPRICVRVGVYGDYWNIPAGTVFEMPEGILDGYYRKGVIDEEENETSKL